MPTDLLLRGLRQFLGIDREQLEGDFKKFNANSSEALVGSVIYDPDNRALSLTYVGGKSYTYWNVSEATYKDFKAASSRGKFVNFSVKPGHLYSRGAF